MRVEEREGIMKRNIFLLLGLIMDIPLCAWIARTTVNGWQIPLTIWDKSIMIPGTGRMWIGILFAVAMVIATVLSLISNDHTDPKSKKFYIFMWPAIDLIGMIFWFPVLFFIKLSTCGVIGLVFLIAVWWLFRWFLPSVSTVSETCRVFSVVFGCMSAGIVLLTYFINSIILFIIAIPVLCYLVYKISDFLCLEYYMEL